METQTVKANKSPHLLIWAAGIAVILFCAAGTAAIMGWIPTSIGHPSDNAKLVAEQLPANTAKPSSAKPRAAYAAPVAKPRAAYEAPAAPVQLARNAPATASCSECGVIESTREINSRGEGSGLGAVGGAVVGGVLGNQVGNGRGRDLATVVGAVGGVVAGNEIEKRVKSTKSYEVTVRLDDGSSRVIHEANPPAWRNGDRVKVVNGAIHSN